MFRSTFAFALLAAGLMTIQGCGKGDFSTPKGAAKTFATAMENGDAETAKKACTGADPKVVESMAKVVGSMKQLRDAAMAKFGDDGKTVVGGPGADMDITKKVDEAEEKIDGDNATLTPKSGTPIKLKKVDGDWKVDGSALPAASAGPAGAMFDSMAKAAKETADDINAGKYKSAAEAKTALDQKMFGNLFKG